MAYQPFLISNELSALAGLIVQEATYGAAETDKDDPFITLDVTTQLQALVRNSQLHIPGGDSRVFVPFAGLNRLSLMLSEDSFTGFFRPGSFRTEIASDSLFIPKSCPLCGDP